MTSELITAGLGMEYAAFVIALFRKKRQAALLVGSIIVITVLLLFFMEAL